jgi:Fe-S-cluster-containing hydrogenase component 2
MAGKDLHERLCRYYEFIAGPMPDRNRFVEVLRQTVTSEDLAVFFLLPFLKPVSFEKLKSKSTASPQDIQKSLDRMASEGIVMSYETDEGPSYQRSHVVFMTEQQVRSQKDTTKRRFYAELFNKVIDGELVETPTKTPYFRVIPAEASFNVKSGSSTAIRVGEYVKVDSGPMPLEAIYEILKNEGPLIGVTECYCRKTKSLIGKECDYPIERCFVLNEQAQALIKVGIAREVTFDWAYGMLKDCEQMGLVHQVDNCESRIRSICNCCPCCCVVLNFVQRGATNVGAPSPFVARQNADRCRRSGHCTACCPTGARTLTDQGPVVDEQRCIGCGLCVTACPYGGCRLINRTKMKIPPKNHHDLYSRLGREALIGKIRKKLFSISTS